MKRKKKVFLSNLLYLLITVFGTYYFATMPNSNDLLNTGSMKSRGVGIFLKTIKDTIGQNGIILIGSIISIIILYRIYSRFNKRIEQ